MVAVEAMLSHAFTKFEPKGMGIRSVNLWTRSWMANTGETIQFKEPAMNTRGALSRIKLILENFAAARTHRADRHENYRPGRPNGHQKSLFTSVRARDNLLEMLSNWNSAWAGPSYTGLRRVEPWSRIPERRYALIPLSR